MFFLMRALFVYFMFFCVWPFLNFFITFVEFILIVGKRISMKQNRLSFIKLATNIFLKVNTIKV